MYGVDESTGGWGGVRTKSDNMNFVFVNKKEKKVKGVSAAQLSFTWDCDFFS